MSFLAKLFGNTGSSRKRDVSGKLAFLEVDMHNHLLPAIDDGSTSVQQSLGLITGLHEMGLRKLICTPHVMEGVYPNTESTIDAAHKELKLALIESQPAVQIYTAAEHMIDDNLTALIANNKLHVMPGDYVLIEMSYLAEAKALFQVIADIQVLGYKPILAHPERYNYYHANPEIYKRIKDTGCLLQLNLLAISSYYGAEVKKAAHEMIKWGIYDFVGTDMHHEKHLAALEDVVIKYPVQDMLKTCTILNPSLKDHLY